MGCPKAVVLPKFQIFREPTTSRLKPGAAAPQATLKSDYKNLKAEAPLKEGLGFDRPGIYSRRYG